MPCGSSIVAGCRSRGSSLLVKFRAVSEADRLEIDKWIEADDSHRGQITADKFLVAGRTWALYAVGDEQGAVMYVRQESEGSKTRMHIQFSPDRRRAIAVMREGFPYVAADAKKRGFKAVVFYSHSPALVKFVISNLGFRADCEAQLV